ncbi:hypothetical protein HPB47_018278 [Ixodes persulcatus]|uniref:Uncharacterized protein n=1 Tax=Ixodes persulcatus TaxID=34615 RepID=A0AC60QLD1_IXOPE|nr:hypothetical protein HPB47_018278 [Ixodes persulcatus]
MALSTLNNPVLDDEDDECNFWSMFAAHQAALQRRRMLEQNVLAEIDELLSEQKRAERRRNRLVLAAARLCSRERHVWAYPRARSWYETTLPYFPERTFRENFRLDRSTFRYIVSVCECMRRNNTNMRQAIPLEKRVAIALYRLATSAEDRTVANLFGVSRSFVNIIFREFCGVLVQRLEPRFVKFPRAHDLAEHLRQFAASEAKTFEGISVGPVLLADQAFPLQCHMMKPFPQPGSVGVNTIVRAGCVLHNICEQLNDRCEKSWLDTVQNDDRSRPQPVRSSRVEEPSGNQGAESGAETQPHYSLYLGSKAATA